MSIDILQDFNFILTMSGINNFSQSLFSLSLEQELWNVNACAFTKNIECESLMDFANWTDKTYCWLHNVKLQQFVAVPTRCFKDSARIFAEYAIGFSDWIII